MGHPVARQAKGPPATGVRRDLHRDLASERRNLHLGAERRLPDGDGQLHVDVVFAALEDRMRGYVDPQVKVAARAAARAGTPFARRAHPRAIADTGGGLHLDAMGLGHLTRAPTRRTGGLPLPSRAVARGAEAELLELHRPPRPAACLLQADLDLALDIPPAAAARTGPEGPTPIELLALEWLPSGAEVAEDRAEELREAAEVARRIDVDTVAARARSTWRLPAEPAGAGLG